jgi:hypothetical protein
MITHDWTELSPAYGRDYKTQKDVKSAFLDGKDFEGDMTTDFRLCSVRDFAPGVRVLLRYRALSMVTSVQVPQ